MVSNINIKDMMMLTIFLDFLKYNCSGALRELRITESLTENFKLGWGIE